MTEPGARTNDWLQRLAAGDDEAVEAFWARYGGRMMQLAERRLSLQLRRRVDPEDAVQSACRTFFRRLQGGEFALADDDHLWRLLCVITLRKVRRQARWHGRDKRGLSQEQHLDAAAEASTDWRLIDAEPTPQQCAVFAEELERLLSGLDAEEQQLVRLKLEQHTNAEIAEQMGCSERTVRRIVKRVQSRWRRLAKNE